MRQFNLVRFVTFQRDSSSFDLVRIPGDPWRYGTKIRYTMNFRLLASLVLGLLSGGIAGYMVGVKQHRDPVLACTGHVTLDTTSPEDLRLNGAIFVDNSGAHNGRIYLRFKDDAAMNDAIGNYATLTGALHAIRIDDGQYISELLVDSIEYHPEISELVTPDEKP